MTLHTHLFPYLDDNYGVLIHDDVSGETTAIDAGDGAAVLAELDNKGWKLTQLWITHHHWDHTDGLMQVKEATGCTVYGPKEQSTPIDGLDVLLVEGDTVSLGEHKANILHTPGHTTDMINFHFADEKIICTGDTLFSLGCGRIFEGNPPMMWESMTKFLGLPRDTQVFGGHEYTLANASFAVTVDPNNEKLAERVKQVEALRAEGKPTVPSMLGEEFDTNPFLRAADPGIRAHLGMESNTDSEVFTEIRKRKDNA